MFGSRSFVHRSEYAAYIPYLYGLTEILLLIKVHAKYRYSSSLTCSVSTFLATHPAKTFSTNVLVIRYKMYNFLNKACVQVISH